MADLVKHQQADLPAAYARRTENIWIDDYLDDKQSELSRYVQIIFKRKWTIAVIAALIFAGVATYTFTTPREYTSSVNIQIDPEQAVLPYKDVYATVSDPRYLGTQAQVLKSEALARRTVVRLKLASDPDKVTGLARWFASNVVVSTVADTQVVKVSYKGDDPQFVAQGVNALADEYINYGFEQKRESMAQARTFLQEELNKQEKKLQQSEQKLVDYGRAHNILLPSQETNVILKKVTELNDELTKAEAEVLANQYEGLQGMAVEDYPEQVRSTVMRDLDTRRAELEQKLATAQLRFGPDWPEVKSLTSQLQQVEKQLNAEKNTAIRQAKAAYDLANAKRSRVAAALAKQTQLADRLTQDSIQYDIYKRETETDRQLHEGLLQRLKQTDVSTGLKAGNVHIIDRGHVANLPTSPNVPFNLAVGLILGLALGVGVASAMEFFDRTIKTPEDVERELKLAFLGAIPAFDKSWKETSGGQLMPLEAQSPLALPSATRSSSVYWESYRTLRTSLLFSPDNRPHSILFTSAVPGEGKSTTSVNLAIALAQTGARTLILELDMRRPRLAERLALPLERGISRYLSGQSAFHTEIQQSAVPNLYAVPAGPIPPNPPELLGSPRMASVFELLHRHFDFVIVDGPPLMPLSDALVIAPQVNGVVLVIDGHTSTDKAQKARNLLRSVDAKLLGAVINNVKMDAPPDYYADETTRPTHAAVN